MTEWNWRKGKHGIWKPALTLWRFRYKKKHRFPSAISLSIGLWHWFCLKINHVFIYWRWLRWNKCNLFINSFIPLPTKISFMVTRRCSIYRSFLTPRLIQTFQLTSHKCFSTANFLELNQAQIQKPSNMNDKLLFCVWQVVFRKFPTNFFFHNRKGNMCWNRRPFVTQSFTRV